MKTFPFVSRTTPRLNLRLLVAKSLCVFLCALAIGACSPSPSPTAAPTATQVVVPVATHTSTVEPTATATEIVEPTATPTVPPTATFTPTTEPTATPTATLEPTSTSTPTPEPTATETPVPEPTATPTVPPTATLTRVPRPTATPTAASTAWRGEYYANPDLSGDPAVVREDTVVDFDWADAAPMPGLPAEGFSVRWSGVVRFAEGLYDFHAIMDDGMRVYVDDELLISEWRDEALREVTASRHMTAGNHRLRVEYYDRRHRAAAHLWWEESRTYPDWKAVYWANQNLTGNPVLVRNDAQINFDWQMGSPGGNVPSDHFSVRWTRNMKLEEGTYRFVTVVDDGVRIRVDGQLIIDAWRDHELQTLTAEYVLAGPAEHTLQVEYYDNAFNARISVSWERIGPATYPDWKGEYWSNPLLSGEPTLRRNDRAIEFVWDKSAPAPSLPADQFSVRWTREVEFGSGLYRFYALADDGVRFHVGDQMVMDEWHKATEQFYTVDIRLSGKQKLTVEMYEELGDARIKFWWERIGD